MTKTSGGILTVGVLAVVAAAFLAFQGGSGFGLSPVGITLSVNGGSCVQTLTDTGAPTPLVTVKNGQAVVYSSSSNSFSFDFQPAGFINTGSPFKDKTGAYQLRIVASGTPYTTAPSNLTLAEKSVSIFNPSITNFLYQPTMTIDGQSCRVSPDTGVHVEK